MVNRSFVLARAVGIWLTLVAVESIHGMMRRLFLEPHLGDLRARQVSVFIGTVLITFGLLVLVRSSRHDVQLR